MTISSNRGCNETLCEDFFNGSSTEATRYPRIACGQSHVNRTHVELPSQVGFPSQLDANCRISSTITNHIEVTGGRLTCERPAVVEGRAALDLRLVLLTPNT